MPTIWSTSTGYPLLPCKHTRFSDGTVANIQHKSASNSTIVSNHARVSRQKNSQPSDEPENLVNEHNSEAFSSDNPAIGNNVNYAVETNHGVRQQDNRRQLSRPFSAPQPTDHTFTSHYVGISAYGQLGVLSQKRILEQRPRSSSVSTIWPSSPAPLTMTGPSAYPGVASRSAYVPTNALRSRGLRIVRRTKGSVRQSAGSPSREAVSEELQGGLKGVPLAWESQVVASSAVPGRDELSQPIWVKAAPASASYPLQSQQQQLRSNHPTEPMNAHTPRGPRTEPQGFNMLVPGNWSFEKTGSVGTISTRFHSLGSGWSSPTRASDMRPHTAVTHALGVSQDSVTCGRTAAAFMPALQGSKLTRFDRGS